MTQDAPRRRPPAGWEGILAPDEAIRWQGRPDPRWHIDRGNWLVAALGAAFSGFAVFWMVLAASAGGAFWTFGLIHFTIGLAIAASVLIWPTIRRRHTWYTLTNKRAFVATDAPLRRRTLSDYRITAHSRLALIDGTPGSVTFGRAGVGKRAEDLRFERIADATGVYRLMRFIQADLADQAGDAHVRHTTDFTRKDLA